jgi:hypothetical protein
VLFEHAYFQRVIKGHFVAFRWALFKRGHPPL